MRRVGVVVAALCGLTACASGSGPSGPGPGGSAGYDAAIRNIADRLDTDGQTSLQCYAALTAFSPLDTQRPGDMMGAIAAGIIKAQRDSFARRIGDLDGTDDGPSSTALRAVVGKRITQRVRDDAREAVGGSDAADELVNGVCNDAYFAAETPQDREAITTAISRTASRVFLSR